MYTNINKVESLKKQNNVLRTKEPEKEALKPQVPEDKELTNAAKYMVGATILAASVAFGILVHKKLNKRVLEKIADKTQKSAAQVSNINKEAVKTPKMEITPQAQEIYNETAQKLHAQNPINTQTIEKNIFKSTEDNFQSWPAADMKSYYAGLEKESARIAAEKAAKEALEQQRMLKVQQHRETLFKPEDKQVKITGKPFNREETIAVKSYQDNYSYNSKLRNGKIIPDEVEEIRILDKIAQEAPALADDAVVYRGIKTRVWYEPERKLPIADKIKKGAIIEDPSYVSTARQDCDLLTHFNPVENPAIGTEDNPIGYMMRIKLPKGAKVIDCRRGGMYSDEVILPRNSKIRINDIDEVNHILDCEYLLSQ